jgi:hypothetical protein
MVRHWFVSLCASLILSSVVVGQCYDLRSTSLYGARGRYQEWWDKPLWNGQTGNENFHIDEPTWGRAFHFALFDIGIVRKTPQGWIPSRAVRKVDRWCDPTPERSGAFCYIQPYQKPSLQAKIHLISDAVESWSLSKDGIIHYHFHDDHSTPRKIENDSDYKLLPHEFGIEDTDTTNATLDLNTGTYQFESSGYGNGLYIRRYPGTGVKVWRIDTFHAETALHEVPCPASLKGIALNSNQPAPEIEFKTVQTCVAKIKEAKADSKEKPRELWEFVQNINEVASPEKCVQVFESPKPINPNGVSITRADPSSNPN